MTISKAERLRAVHEEALRDFDEIQIALRDERLQCLEDRRFYSLAGAQWEGGLGDQFENKPRFEMNKVHLAVIRIVNEYRNNRVTVDFTPKDGVTNDKMADVCDGLYRADEQDSTAQEAYDNAFEEAVGGGFGAWRLRACYEDEYDDENTKQRIKIEPIFDADSSVWFDLNAKRQDKADAKRCYVITAMSPSAYAAEYDDDPSSWPKSVQETYFDWCSPDVVYVAEYYKVEEKTEIVHVYRGLDDQDMMVPQSELDADETKEQTLLATGFRVVRQKKIKSRQVHKYILSGKEVLSDEGIIAGKCIPIVPVYGKRWFVDNVERCMGHVRLAKDAQRLANMLRSNLGEIASLSGREKPILTPQQIAGHSMMWAEDNVKEYPFLLVNPLTGADGQQVASGPIGYTKAPSVPPALAALMGVVEQDLSDLLGNQAAAEKMQPNISGKAVELIQNHLDMQAFIYMSNFAKGMHRSGEIWLSMCKDLIVEDSRRMKTIDSQGEAGSVVMNQPGFDAETDSVIVENDMAEADFDLNVSVGPTSDSRRAATVRALTGMMQITQDPETLGVLTSMAMMNMEGEGIADVRDFFRKKMLVAGVIKPTDEEAEELAAAQQNQQPDANTVYLLASAQKQEADAGKAKADTIDTLAAAELKEAQKLKTLAEAGKTMAESEAPIAAEPGMAQPSDQLVAVLGQLAQAMSNQAPAQAPQPRKPSRIEFERDPTTGDIVGASHIPQE